jgi:hypothetical protein
MPTYLFAYRAPTDYETGQPREMEAWRSYFEQLGDAVLNIGNPVFSRAAVGTVTSDTDLGGYSLVAAASLTEASSLARDCPFVALGGGVEVGELTPLSVSQNEAGAGRDAAGQAG